LLLGKGVFPAPKVVYFSTPIQELFYEHIDRIDDADMKMSEEKVFY